MGRSKTNKPTAAEVKTDPGPAPTPTPMPAPDPTPGPQTQTQAPVADVIDVFVCTTMRGDKDKKDSIAATMKAWFGMEKVLDGLIRVRVLTPDAATAQEARAAGRLEFEQVVDVVSFLNNGEIASAEAIDQDEINGHFQRDRRIAAECLADSDWYVLADDDCIPVGSSFIDRAIRIINNPSYSEFGMLAAMPSNPHEELVIHPWRPHKDASDPSNYYSKSVFMDEQVMEHVDVGGIRFVRDLAMPDDPADWDPIELPSIVNNNKWRYDRVHCDQMRRHGYRVGFMKAVKMVHLGERTRAEGAEKLSLDEHGKMEPQEGSKEARQGLRP